jgi:hypothetical protein
VRITGALDGLSERFRGLSGRDRRALLLGALLLTPMLLWALVVRPYRNVLAEFEDRLATERGLLERERAAMAEAPTLPARLQAVRAELAKWNGRFVQSANPALAEAEVTSMLETVARESRVLLQEVGALTLPPDVTAPEGLLPFRLSVRGESDFEGVLRFLNGVEENPVLLRVVGLSIEPAPQVFGGGGGGGGGGGRGGNQGRGGGGPPPVQPGAMTFVVIVEAYVPGEAPADTGT